MQQNRKKIKLDNYNIQLIKFSPILITLAKTLFNLYYSLYNYFMSFCFGCPIITNIIFKYSLYLHLFMDKSASYLVGGILGITATIIGYKIIESRRNKAHEPIQMKEIKPISQILTTYSKQFNQSGAIERVIPRRFQTESNLQSLTSNLFYRKTNSHLSSLTKGLSDPIYDLLDRGGKRWRPILCMLIAELYGRRKQDIYDLAAACQIIHNGTLIVDDIEDSSTVRRDKQCVHLIYGMDISINAGNFMYFAPMNYLLKSKKYTPAQQVQFGRIFAQQMTSLHIGQGWDILWHNLERLQGKYPTQDHYLQMTAHKTGVLARLSVQLVCAYLNIPSNQTKILTRFAETMGVAFQIQDDLLNLQGQEYMKTKGYSGQDIHQGKITLMVIYFLNSTAPKEKKDRLIDILKKKTTDKSEIKQAIEILRNYNSLQMARLKMTDLIQKAWKDVQNYIPNNIYRHYLRQLSQYAIKRNK